MHSFKNLSRKTKIILLLVCIFLIILGGAVWFLRPYPAETEYLNQVYNNEQISVTELDNWYELTPKKSNPDKAIIFYPGGLVSADAYLYMLSGIAEQTSQPIYVAKFPLSLAITKIGAADAIIEAHPKVETWTISGHSLGGAMACRYVESNPEKIDILVLMASYCDKSISNTEVSVLTLYGSKNNGIDESALKEFERNLPEGATTILIEGMNHAQFGNYGPQKGDNESTISDDDATTEAVSKTVEFLTSLEEKN